MTPLSRIDWIHVTASTIERLKEVERTRREMAAGDGAFALIRKEIIKEANITRDQWEKLQSELEAEILKWAEEIKLKHACREIQDEINVYSENSNP